MIQEDGAPVCVYLEVEGTGVSFMSTLVRGGGSMYPPNGSTRYCNLQNGGLEVEGVTEVHMLQ